MSPERTGEGPSPEDAPDWFEAEENGDASADSSTGEDGWLDDVAAEGWFDDPDHRPIDAGAETTDEPAESDPGNVFDGESGAADGTTGAAESTGPAGAETPEVEKPDAAATTVEPGIGADRGESPENAPEAVAPQSGSDDRGTDTSRGDEREVGEPDVRGKDTAERDDRETDRPERDSRGTATGERTTSEAGETSGVEEPSEGGETAETDGTDETDEMEVTGSYVRRVLAWLRSLVGRLA